MATTVLRGTQILDGTVQRADLDDGIAGGVTGKAVVRKLIQGTGITLSSTGFDAGTGDVTISASGGGGNVSTSGTITTGQHARWASATTLESITAATAKTDLSLNNVTNDAQTQAAVVPNTSPAGGEILVGTGLGPYLKKAISGSGATISLASTGIMTISAISDGAITSSGTWNTASSERRQWDGSSTNLVAATGRTSLAIGDAAVYENANASGQGPGFATDTYLTGSTITLPTAGGWQSGGQYHCVFDMTKTNAGTAAPTFNVRMGTLGTTGDASVGTLVFTAPTASAAEVVIIDVYVTFRSVGSGTSAVIITQGRATKNLYTTTGFAALANVAGVNSAGFNSTTQTKLGLSFNGGASFAGSIQSLQTQYMQ